MTSNLGVAATGDNLGLLQRDANVNARALRERIEKKLGQVMPPEILSRIGKIIFFQPLGRDAVREIIDKIVGAYHAPLSERGLMLTLESGAYDLLMMQGYSTTFGAREMERTIERLLMEPLSHLLLESDSPGTSLRARAKNERIVFEML